MEANDRRERAAQEAAEWFVRLDSDLPREERAQFVAWLHESPMHVAEMIRMAQVHGAVKDFGPWGRSAGTVSATQHDTVVPFPVRPGPPAQPRASGPNDSETLHRIASQADAGRAIAYRGDARSGAATHGARYRVRAGQRRRLAKLLCTGAAAAIAMVVLATGIILPKFRGHVIDTERGERREVVLDDGSIVLVDPETSMRVKYETGSRRVFLERGRALFRVARNPRRPFLVEVDGTVVRAVGTAFGVEQQVQGVVVTVAEGKVAVLSPHESARAQGAAAAPGDARALVQGINSEVLPPEAERKGTGLLFLTSDQQVTVPRSGAIETVRTVDSRRELAWAEGRLVFRNYTVASVVAEFNRYNRVQLEVTDPVLAGRTVSGVFNASDPESFISFLQTVAAVSVLHRDEQTIAIALSRTH